MTVVVAPSKVIVVTSSIVVIQVVIVLQVALIICFSRPVFLTYLFYTLFHIVLIRGIEFAAPARRRRVLDPVLRLNNSKSPTSFHSYCFAVP